MRRFIADKPAPTRAKPAEKSGGGQPLGNASRNERMAESSNGSHCCKKAP